ncbi:MAG TPA: Mpo1-like protein [Vicinamibacterales bacterium]|nr:Mpo1-like protein [Vicinamibacterales bacterium]
MTFRDALATQRWDDHRYYHHNRINQSLHLVSALSFIASYVLLFTSPAAAVLTGWLVAMPTRQIGHFFFEPKGYDEANGATHEHKEDIKVGYNLHRKVVLLSIWVLSPLLLALTPRLFGLLPAAETWNGLANNVSMVWLGVGVGALLFRAGQLFFQQSVQTGIVWLVKILTDPFHDVMLYHRSPIYVWRGELFDPIVIESAR